MWYSITKICYYLLIDKKKGHLYSLIDKGLRTLLHGNACMTILWTRRCVPGVWASVPRPRHIIHHPGSEDNPLAHLGLGWQIRWMRARTLLIHKTIRRIILALYTTQLQCFVHIHSIPVKYAPCYLFYVVCSCALCPALLCSIYPYTQGFIHWHSASKWTGKNMRKYRCT